MRDEDDALFTGRGALPEDLARVERALSKLPLPPEPDWNARPRRERRPPVFAWAAIAGHWYRTLDGGLTLTTFHLLGGLVNLVFGIVVFKLWQAVPKASPSAEVLLR